MSDLDALGEQLRAHRRVLDEELLVLTKPPTDGTPVQYGKRAGDGTGEAVERLTTTSAARTLDATGQDIDRALEKLEAGTYGKCDSCGKPIPIERLQVIPWAYLCVTCSAARRR